MKKYIFTVLILWLIPVVLIGASQGKPLVMGESITIHSKVLKEDRTLWIYFPKSYTGSTDKYPVLYLLDGDTHFHYLTGFVDFFSTRDNMPEMIVVAIPNTHRMRDLTPIHWKSRPTSGGGGNFLKFLKEELFPYVEGRYRTQPYRTLAGHSLSAFFTLHVLLTQPDMFNAYIAASPPFYWGDKLLFKEGETFPGTWKTAQAGTSKGQGFSRFLFYTVGGLETEDMRTNARGFEKLLKQKAPKGLDWHFRFLEKDEHGTISHRTFCNGLETLFEGFLFPLEDPSVQSLEGIKTHYRRLSDKYGYHLPVPRMIANLVGYDLMMQGKPEEAVKVLTFNAGNYPQAPDVFNLLGLVYQNRKQLAEAETQFQKACELAKRHNDPRLKNFQRNLERVRKKRTGSQKSD